MRYRVCFDGHEFALPEGESIVGRDAASRIRLDHPSVSRRHGRLLVVGDAVTIEDLDSKNGVLVNGAPIARATRLSHGDTVQAGRVSFSLRCDDAFAVAEATGVQENGYQPPLYRTCVSCRGLLDGHAARCPRCGAPQEAQVAPATMRLWVDPHGRRMAYRAEVKLRGLYVSSTMTLEGEVSDLSLGGAFFACDLLEEPGTVCDLVVMPSADSEAIRFGAEVVRVSEAGARRAGLGLRFTKMAPAAQAWLMGASEPPKDEL